MRRRLCLILVAVFAAASVAAAAFGSGTAPQATFSVDEPGATYTCKLDAGTTAACTSPKGYTNLAQGTHKLTVVATFQVSTPASSAAFTYTPPSPVTGSPTTFDASTSTCGSPPCSYAWTASDSGGTWAIGSGQTIQYTFTVAAQKTITLTVTDAQNRSATTRQTITVEAPSTTTTTSTTPTTSTTTTSTTTAPSGTACLGAPGSSTPDYASLDACGYPSPNTAGVPAGTVLQNAATANLPAGASWQNGYLLVSGNNVTVSNLEVDGNVYVLGSNVTITRSLINDPSYDQAVHEDGAATGLTITDSTIHGVSSSNPGSQGILGGPGFTLLRDYIYHEVEAAEGSGITIRDSYLVSDGSVSGGHNEPIDIDDGSSPPNLIQHNTLLDPLGQTAAIIVGGPYGIVHDTTLDNNIVAGGGWTIYCCDASSWGATGAPVNTAVTNNRFSRLYYAKGGYWGPMADLTSATTFTGNIWDDTLQPIS